MRPNFSSNNQLVDYLIDQDRIDSKRVERAFRKVDRKDFVPENHRDEAYADKPVPINGVTISAPHIVAEVTELLELEGEEKVLEIGSGSGYQAAILSHLADEVVGIEINEDLAKDSEKKVPQNVEITIGNGFNKISEKLDRILFSCATEDFEHALKYIESNGVIVGPVKENGKQVLKKWKSGDLSRHGRVRYVEMQ